MMAGDLDKIFRPRSIAVVGASRDPGSFGQRVVRCLLEGGVQGRLYPVNPKAKVINSLPCYAQVSAIPDPVDLAVIVVPAAQVVSAVEKCAKQGVRGIVVISAGFKEVGPEGEDLERRLLAVVRRHRMRMMGPNSMGVINTDPAVRMNATFAPAAMVPGRIAFMSQSGAMGMAILNYARERSLGLGQYASVGNKTDVSANDLLEYWRDDPETRAILLYMESFGNPRRFTSIARTVTPQKPIIAVKAGRTAPRLRVADRQISEFTKRDVPPGAEIAVDALFEQCGVLRVQTLEELFDLAQAIINQPLPRSGQVAVLTNGGGPGIMAADALEGLGLDVPPLDPRTIAELRAILPPQASIKNPVDMSADAAAELYGRAIPRLLADPNIAALLVIYVGVDYTEVAEAILAHGRDPRKPVLVCLMAGRSDDPGLARLRSAGVPVYFFPEAACRVIRHLHDYRRYQERPQEKVKRYRGADQKRVEKVISKVREEGRIDLKLDELRAIARTYGAKVPRDGVASSEADAVKIAGEIGYPVVVKLWSTRFRKKTDIGGVVLDVRNESEVRRAYRAVLESGKRRQKEIAAEGVLVQEMLKEGQELIVGVNHDPIFGSVLKLGAGGIYADMIQDFVFRITPITPPEALEMIRSLKIFPLLEGSRGRTPIHLPSLVDVLCRSSQLSEDFPEVREFEINPLIMFPRRKDFWAVDGRMRLFKPEEMTTRIVSDE